MTEAPRVAWTRDASAELDHMLAHIATQDAFAARLVATHALTVEKSIAEFPKAGRYDGETDTYHRYIPKTRIILTYAIRQDVVWIDSAWHTSRASESRPVR